jgi:formylglycine-generating enzyme required for sulfatase activity
MPNLPEQTAKFSEQIENLVRIVRHGKREQAFFLAGFLCLGLPIILPEALQKIIIELFPNFLQKVFSWLSVIGVALLVWGIVLVWKKALPRKLSVAATVKPSAIKGPFAFGEMDGEIFSQLGREADLGKLLGWVVDSQICFAALKGESGAGKTSLLRAGLTYTLTREKEKYGVTPIYWEAVPENSTAELLRAIHFACPEEKESLQNLDDLAGEVSGNKKVIIIDQAEQLLPEKHPALFDLFKKIVAQKPPYTTTWIIAFREEYASTWFDFEAAVPDFLPPKHSLKIFTEPQARDIVAVLAKESGLAPNNAVIVAMVNAMSDKGKVSPVEIGIGMMVLNELYSGADGDISLGQFQDVGGVTGLLRAYIKGKLEDGMPEHERSPMQNALLDLIDPEISHQRLSQGKSASELANTAPLPLHRMQHNLRYLASQEVRILEQLPVHSQPEPDVKYRLAHERLIPALESLAGELLAAAEQARRLLGERFRTWVKARQRKFLLSGKELRDVLKYRRYFAGTLTPELLRYIGHSNKTRYIKISLGVLFVLALLLWQPFKEKVIEPWRRDQRLKNFTTQLVAVDGGVFAMGDSAEAPLHQVKLADFKISAYEITNQQYCDFLNADDSAKVKASAWLDFSSSYSQIRKKDGRFVVLDEVRKDDPVKWFGAAAFCNYMSVRNGYKPFYNVNDWSCDFSAKGFRLPTEAEWEYAARGGNKSKGYLYSGSDSIEAVAWYYENSDSKIHAVGKKQSNELGLYDMSGNVYEWCNDWYGGEYYEACKKQGVVENPVGPEIGSYRVLRGGYWISGAQDCRSANRLIADPDNRSLIIGFRLVFVP